jgi:nucleoside-diphosphate-sugar epimerase
MNSQHGVLLLGGTGRTGGRVLTQLLERGVPVRAIVRSAERLPQGTAGDPRLEVVEAEVLSLTPADWARHLDGCDAVVSCLGHTTSIRGILGPPRELVQPVVERVCDAIRAMRPARSVRVILMSSVSVSVPDGRDSRRGSFERAVMRGLCALVPPAADNQAATDYLCSRVGADDPYVQWVAVRPDTLRDGGVCEYSLHEGLQTSLARPDDTNMANVAHFMCDLATNEESWERWRARTPVIVNTGTAAA